jgi:hypothetical protein
MKEIVLTFSEAGEIVIEVFGCDGPECLDETRAFEKALGQPFARTVKPEFESTFGIQKTISR